MELPEIKVNLIETNGKRTSDDGVYGSGSGRNAY